MLEKIDYVNAKFLINLCGNTDFNSTTGWSTGVYADALSRTDVEY
jgi:hypothetical protein